MNMNVDEKDRLRRQACDAVNGSLPPEQAGEVFGHLFNAGLMQWLSVNDPSPTMAFDVAINAEHRAARTRVMRRLDRYYDAGNVPQPLLDLVEQLDRWRPGRKRTYDEATVDRVKELVDLGYSPNAAAKLIKPEHHTALANAYRRDYWDTRKK
jgi:hypothetical protein